ncbi:DUF3472 domain-containing protein [Kitasatospora sp. NPDC048296]|uniref:RICIN domain-containing protein n=1 Tax=Kitasatospora sp. NPDC048296 TaxID=3364048 RepID=UPI00371BF3D0
MHNRPTRVQRLSGARRLALASGLGAMAIALAGAGTAAADEGHTPGTYTYYTFPSGTGSLHDVSWTTTPAYDPGYTAEIFWSHQFDFDNQHTAYIGMQSNGGSPRKVLFSAWDTTESKPGSPGSSCKPFGGEGTGQQCSAALDWQADHTYRFKVAATTGGWFDATVTDQTTGTTIDLGSIKTKATGISPDNMVDWTEYFEWNDPRSTCYDQPNSAVTFGLPTGNAGTVTAAATSTELRDFCKPQAKAELTAQGSTHRNAIGNSARGPLQNGRSCLTAQGTPGDGTKLTVSDCTPTADRAWVLAPDQTLRLPSNYCLTEQSSTTAVRDCAGAADDGKVADPAKQWTYDATARTLRNKKSEQCLTATPDGTPVTRPCTPGSTDQTWSVPTRDGAPTDHGPANGVPPTAPSPTTSSPHTPHPVTRTATRHSDALPLLLGGTAVLIAGAAALLIALHRRNRARRTRG